MTEAITRGEYANVHAVLIAKDGHLVYEEYFKGIDRRWLDDGTKQEVSTVFGRDTLHGVRSVTKSITSAAFGLVLADGAIESLDEPLFDFFPEYTSLASPEKQKITLRHVLTMSAGLDWNEDEVALDGNENHETVMYTSQDPAGFILSRPIETEPGERWTYNGGLTTLLGYVVSRATGQSFGAYARERLFEPLGITQVEWGWAGERGEGLTGTNAWRDIPELQWSGSQPWSLVASPFVALWLRPRDLLKFGSLYLNRGCWNGRQVLPEEWVARSIQDHIERPGSPEEHGDGVTSSRAYGYQWWHDRFQLPYGKLTVHAAYGRGGQRIWVIPELGVTAVQLAGNYDDWKAGYQAERLLLERIVPWALGIDAMYQHQLSRPVLQVEPGDWPILKLTDKQRAAYIGKYDQEGDELTVRDAAGILELTLPGPGAVQLIPQGNHVFAVGRVIDFQTRKVFWPTERMVFEIDATGKAARYEWRNVETGSVSQTATRVHAD